MKRFKIPSCISFPTQPTKPWAVWVNKPIISQEAQKSALNKSLVTRVTTSLLGRSLPEKLFPLILLSAFINNAVYADDNLKVVEEYMRDNNAFDTEGEYDRILHIEEARKFLYFYPNITCVGINAAYKANVNSAIKIYEVSNNVEKDSEDKKIQDKFSSRWNDVLYQGKTLQIIRELIADDCKD